jgi:signal transduction histidine kinase
LGKNIDLVTRLDPSLGLVRVDPVEMSQALLNLAVNARDAMPSGGKLTIASSNATISNGSVVPAVPAGQYVQLTVADTGTGMNKEVLDHLFEPFFTTKEAGKGTGLGLSIIFGIVKQRGGHIRVESAPGRGTSFSLFLPRT